MRNLLVLFLFFASTLITGAQTEYKNNDLGTDNNNWNNLDNDIVSIYEPSSASFLNTEVINIDRVNPSYDSDNTTTESFVALHLNVIGLTTQTSLDAAIDIYRNSDFIKDYSGIVESGNFNIQLKDFGWYLISLSAPGYFDKSDTVWIVSEERKTINRDIYMVPIEAGMKITNNINFNFDKNILSEESMVDLEKEVLFLNENPNVVFEIAGHTDSDGSKGYNLLLSQRRAQAVVDYLVSKGAERAQLIARGYGETRPVNGNDTKADRANNRRVVFTVLSTESVAVAKHLKDY